MSNLGRSQADWRKLFREFGIFLAPQLELRVLQERFDLARTRTRALELGDASASTSDWQLAGVRIGSNTDESGQVFVRVALATPVVGQAQVSIFRAPGGVVSDLVAQGAGSPATIISLAAQNASGLSGTVRVGASPASESDDKHRLLLFPSWAVRMHGLFDGSAPEHGELLQAFMVALAAAEKAFAQALAAFETATDTFLGTRWKNFQRSSASAPIEKTAESDEGAISTIVSGLLEDGRDNMRDEALAGRQSVARTSVLATGGVFDATNTGRGALAAPIMYEWARPGRVTAVCSGAEIGAERFVLSQHEDETGEDQAARGELQVRRPYSDPELGIKAAFLDRVLTLDAGSPDDFGSIGGWSVQGEDAGNTDHGKIALKVVASGSAFQVEGYLSASFDPATQVFRTAPGVAGAGVAILPANGSGLSGTAVLGTAPTAGRAGVLNLNPFVQGDKFVIDVELRSRGAFQEELARLYGFALESEDAARATIDDRYVTSGTLPPFEDVS